MNKPNLQTPPALSSGTASPHRWRLVRQPRPTCQLVPRRRRSQLQPPSVPRGIADKPLWKPMKHEEKYCLQGPRRRPAATTPSFSISCRSLYIDPQCAALLHLPARPRPFCRCRCVDGLPVLCNSRGVSRKEV